MQILDWIRFAAGIGFLCLGVLVLSVQVYGVFKYKYVLNRMHSSAMGDTAGIGFAILGLIILTGISFVSLKLLAVVAFLWCASPVSSHLITKLELTTNPDLQNHCDVDQEIIKELEKEVGVQLTEKGEA